MNITAMREKDSSNQKKRRKSSFNINLKQQEDQTTTPSRDYCYRQNSANTPNNIKMSHRRHHYRRLQVPNLTNITHSFSNNNNNRQNDANKMMHNRTDFNWRHQLNKPTRRRQLQQTRPQRILLTSVITPYSSLFILVLFAFSHLVTTNKQVQATQALIGDQANIINTTIIQQQQQLASSKQQIQATFSTPNQAINITHVTYDPLYDAVYLGATNTIYQLNGSDLSVQYEQSTGPVLDSPSCGITECNGFEDYMKPTQNVNKILVVDYQHKKLLSCGSTKQGACRRYQLNNIAQKEDLISMAVAANDDNSSTYAFIAPARYTYDPSSSPSSTSSLAQNYPQQQQQQQQQVLYVGSTYTKVGQSRDLLVPSIGTRILDDGPNLLKLYENSFLDSARIDINSHLRDYFLVNYLYGFASSNYIYFVTVQKKATSRDFEELGYHTRLARICITDSSYNSYTEVDLKCVPNNRRRAPGNGGAGSAQGHQAKHSGFFSSNSQQQQQQQQQSPNEYPILQDAILVDAGSQLLQSLAQNDQFSSAGGGASFLFGAGAKGQPISGDSSSSPDDNKVLLGVFSSAKDHTQHAGDHSAICAFSLAQIEDKFNDNIHNCYTGKMQSRNMEYIAGNVQECPKSGQGGNVVNFCHETLKINGTIPIVAEASIEFHNTTLTAITATSHINSRVKNIYSEQLAGADRSSSSSAVPTPAASLSSKISGATANSPTGAAASLRQNTVAFVGTSNGHIKKILLNNSTNGIEFEDLLVDPANQSPILGDLHLHSSGNYLIAATPYKVIKVATHNCQQYSNCRECSSSKNPYCGWCSLKRSCTTKSECISSTNQLAEQQQTSRASIELIANNNNNNNNVQMNKQQLKWISSIESTSSKCIELQSISPDKIPMTSTGKVDLHIDRLPRLPREFSYKCVFNGSEQTQASSTPFGLSCPLPKLMDRQRHIQIEPGRDHATVDLAVRSTETNTDFLNGKLTFFECQRHTTCKDCLTANWGCNWCLNENVCLFNASKCDKSSQQQQHPLSPLNSAQKASTILVGSANNNNQRGATVVTTTTITTTTTTGSQTPTSRPNTISQVQQCPTFDVGHQQDILIADGSERQLSIRVKNMPQFKGAIKCIVEIEGYEISLKARIQEDRVICENSTYSYGAEVGLLLGQLKVIYSDSNIFIDRTNFTLYKCHLLGAYLNRPDCSLCQRIDARFNCVWCSSSSCLHRSKCDQNSNNADSPATCPPPRIDFIHPLSGPTLGGTRVTIEGSNLGQSFDEITNRVSIGNAPCRPIEDEYRPSNRIVCLTSPVTGRMPLLADMAAASTTTISGDIIVGNKAGYSIGASKFQFKPIYLRDHQPRYGPQSGGTRLTLSGLNLNIGSSIQVFLDELPCLVELNTLTSEQVVCKTSPSRQASRPIRQLRLIVDDAEVTRHASDADVFYYTQDPVITRVSPLRAYLSGGRPINVFGVNLTSVQAPKMVIYDTAIGKKVNESTCILQDDTRMQCPSPAVNLQLMDLDYSEQHLGAQYEPGHPFQPAPTTTTTNWLPSSSSSSPTTTNKASQLFQQDESVKFRLSFVMDNVVQQSPPLNNLEIAYTSDPKLFPFASGQFKSLQEIELATTSLIGSVQPMTNNELDSQQQQPVEQQYQMEPDTYLLQPNEPVLVLYGEHLKSATSEYEITVTVGQDLCNLTQLTQTRLVCLMPFDHVATPTDEEGHQTQRLLPLVVVRIGFNLRYELGFVQYHPTLLQQIAQNSSRAYNKDGQDVSLFINPAYEQYLPRLQANNKEGFLSKLASYITTAIMLLFYLTIATVLLAFLYMSMFSSSSTKVNRLYKRLVGSRNSTSQHKGHYYLDNGEYRRLQAKVDCLERSVRNECRVASLALQGDLNELIRHVDLSGIPLMPPKQYIMNVFFPGMSQHPLLLNQQQPPATSQEFSMDYFERLVLTKPFLITFINTLERQPNFTIRDRVNVASLVMIVLLERLDYATDILKTLLFQLVERSVVNSTDAANFSDHSSELTSTTTTTSSKLTRRASNLLNGLPISKRHTAGRVGKFVGGSANSLMAQTSVAAQMLLARVGNKTSPTSLTAADDDLIDTYQQHYEAAKNALEQQQQQQQQHHQQAVTYNLPFMSTTTFNQQVNYAQRYPQTLNLRGGHTAVRNTNQRCNSLNRTNKRAARSARNNNSSQAHLMLRRTDTIVEKMLTNWLALNMYDYFQGPIGQSLYVLFEALKCQLERGPVDCISGDAFYSLNESKLLREPNVTFEVVNLYVIVDTSILQADLLLDSNNNNNNNGSNQQYATGNTITLALRVLDCDTISQVKGKILSALYRNSAYSTRLGVDEVELSLRQHPVANNNGLHQTLNVSGQLQQATVSLHDEDYSSVTSFNGMRKINTLRHYGVADQGIMMLNRRRRSNINNHGQSQQRATTNLSEMLDGHYNNPYAEIQYGPSRQRPSQPVRPVASNNNNNKSWHLTDHRAAFASADSSSGSSPSYSHSPSMMLLGQNEGQAGQQQQQQFYHPSSGASSTSSTGNVMDTNSTSANSSSLMNGTNLLASNRPIPQQHQQQQQQPIYCQIGSSHGAADSSYYCQIGPQFQQPAILNQQAAPPAQLPAQARQLDRDQHEIYLARMLTSKGTVQQYIDDFFKTILSVQKDLGNSQQSCQLYEDVSQLESVLSSGGRATSHTGGGGCPPALKWLFDQLDEAAELNGIADEDVVHSWKSNAFLLRFWVNFIKNPNYILDVEKSSALDGCLSVVAQTLMDSCSRPANNSNKISKLTKENVHNKLLFAKDVPKYRELVGRFYEDIGQVRRVSDHEMVAHMGALSQQLSLSGRKFDTRLALKELCVYAVNYGVELMNGLNNDLVCQQLDLSQQLQQCFRSFTVI